MSDDEKQLRAIAAEYEGDSLTGALFLRVADALADRRDLQREHGDYVTKALLAEKCAQKFEEDFRSLEDVLSFAEERIRELEAANAGCVKKYKETFNELVQVEHERDEALARVAHLEEAARIVREIGRFGDKLTLLYEGVLLEKDEISMWIKEDSARASAGSADAAHGDTAAATMSEAAPRQPGQCWRTDKPCGLCKACLGLEQPAAEPRLVGGTMRGDDYICNGCGAIVDRMVEVMPPGIQEDDGWNTAERINYQTNHEARASVALDGDTHVIDCAHNSISIDRATGIEVCDDCGQKNSQQ